jgi:hypothetical protein
MNSVSRQWMKAKLLHAPAALLPGNLLRPLDRKLDLMHSGVDETTKIIPSAPGRGGGEHRTPVT